MTIDIHYEFITCPTVCKALYLFGHLTFQQSYEVGKIMSPTLWYRKMEEYSQCT